MACFNGNCPPIPKLGFTQYLDTFVFQDETIYNDNGGNVNTRKGCWIFYLDKVEVYRTPELFLHESISLGINSTCETLTLENGLQDLIDIFQQLSGVQVQTGQKMGVGRCATVNECSEDIAPEDIIEFLYEGATTPAYTFPITPINGDTPVCPINYNTTVFNLTLFGGNADETFLEEKDLLARLAELNPAAGASYNIDQSTCSFVIVISDTPPPVTTGSLPSDPNGAPTYSFPLVDDTGNPVCPVNYEYSTFDLQLFGGSTNQAFAGNEAESLFLLGLQTLNPAHTAPYTLDATNCTVNVQSNTTPSVITGDIVVDVNIPTYSFPLVDPTGNPVCPIDFTTATINLTDFGGTSAETFANETEFLDRLQVLNPGDGTAYTFDGTTCTVTLVSTTPPNTTTGNVPVNPNGQLPIYSFDIVDTGGLAACPIEYANDSFDMTPFNGSLGETFADQTELIDRLQVLNPGDGTAYQFDGVGCSVSLQSSTMPVVDTADIVVSPIVTSIDYVIDIVDSGNTPICPVDFALTSFNLVPFGGNAAETFLNGGELATRMDVLNPGTNGNWSYAIDPDCHLIISSTTVPANMTDIVATVNPANVQYTILFEDNTNIPGCPDFALMSFNLTSFGGNTAEVFADGAAIAARMDVLNPVTAQNWVYNPGTCQLEVTSTTPPQDHPADVIVYSLLPTYLYAIQEGGNVACPVDYNFAQFDLSLFGGNVDETFADVNELTARMDILNPGGSGNYQFDGTGCQLTLNSVTPPAVTSNLIPVEHIYSFPIVDMGGNDACPLSYGTTTFDLQFIGGGAAESFANEDALLDQLEILNAGIVGAQYTFDSVNCAAIISTSTPPAVTGGNIVATVSTPVTYTFNITHPLVNPVCPIDYNAMNFNFTPFGGGASEFMADQATLLARMETLNPAGTDSYTFNAGTCSVEVTSTTMPAQTSGDIVAVIAPVSYIFFLKDTAGQNTCPLDFANNVFDMSIFSGGGNAETFVDQAALLARFEILNPGDGSSYVFDNTSCLVLMDSVLPPAVTAGDVIVKDTFDLNLLNDDDPGTVEPTGAFRFTPFEDKSISELSIDFTAVFFGGVQTRRLLIKTGGVNGTIIGQSDDISVDISVSGIQTFPFSILTNLTASTTYHIVYADENNVTQTGFGTGMKRTSGVSDTNNEILDNVSGAPNKIRVRIQGILD